MDKTAIISALRELALPCLKSRGADLVDIVCRYENGGLVLRILADRPEGGITLEECACLNRDISGILDEKDILQERYILEVSSPGLDRPLKTKDDFSRCLNKAVRVFLNEPISGKYEVEGLVRETQGSSVYLEIGNKVIEVPISNIRTAKQILEHQ